MAHKHVEHIEVNEPRNVAAINEEFLSRLVSEFDGEHVTAIILKGSCARGEATLYSDVDLTVFVRNELAHAEHKRFYRDGRLISVGMHTIEYYRERFLLPADAIFVVPSTREARILLDKDGCFSRLQQEAKDWKWEPLQEAANIYACGILLEQAEIVHKALRALLVQDVFALAEMILIIFQAVTDALAVQRGILAMSGNSYFRQVQEAIGFDSQWTRYHGFIAGMDTHSISENLLEMRGIAALRLYQETVNILQPVLRSSQHGVVIAQTVTVIEEALAGKQVA